MTSDIKCEWCGTVQRQRGIVAAPVFCLHCHGMTWHYRVDVFDELATQSDDLPAAVRRIRERDAAAAKAGKP